MKSKNNTYVSLITTDITGPLNWLVFGTLFIFAFSSGSNTTECKISFLIVVFIIVNFNNDNN